MASGTPNEKAGPKLITQSRPPQMPTHHAYRASNQLLRPRVLPEKKEHYKYKRNNLPRRHNNYECIHTSKYMKQKLRNSQNIYSVQPWGLCQGNISKQFDFSKNKITDKISLNKIHEKHMLTTTKRKIELIFVN